MTIAGSMARLPSCSRTAEGSPANTKTGQAQRHPICAPADAEGGLAFEAYLPPALAEWIIGLVEHEVFHSPLEAVFVAMPSFWELDGHPDLKQELLNRTIQKGLASAEEGGGSPAEEGTERLRKAMEEPGAEPAVWDKSFID